MSDSKSLEGLTRTVFPKIIPATITLLHDRLRGGEGDFYGERMFAFTITPDMEASSPLLKDGVKVWLIYRRKA